MSATRQSKRSRAIARRPDVVAWVAELERVLRSAPPDVWLFAVSSKLSVMALDADGQRVTERHGGMAQSEVVATPDLGARRVVIDGGDW